MGVLLLGLSSFCRPTLIEKSPSSGSQGFGLECLEHSLVSAQRRRGFKEGFTLSPKPALHPDAGMLCRIRKILKPSMRCGSSAGLVGGPEKTLALSPNASRSPQTLGQPLCFIQAQTPNPLNSTPPPPAPPRKKKKKKKQKKTTYKPLNPRNPRPFNVNPTS